MAPHEMILEHSVAGALDAPLVLFLHGITGSRRYYARKVRRMSERYRLLLPDLPGFGESPKPHIEYTLPFYRDAVRHTVEALGYHERPMHIVGHSLGALIALEYAAAHPEHVDRMVLMNVPRFHDSRVAHEVFWRGSPNYRRLLNEHSLAETVSQWWRCGIGLQYSYRFPISVILDSRKFTLNSLTSTLQNCLLNYRVDDILPQVPESPIRLLHGRLDQVAPIENVRDLPRRYPSMELVEIPDSGHHIFLTHTRQCLELIESHLGSEPATTAVRRSRGPLGDPA